MKFRFYLIDRNNQQTQINEPIGWADTTENLERNPNHGFNQYKELDTLEFDGKAVKILTEEYNNYGIDGDVKFHVDIKCGPSWEEYYRGNIDFTEWYYSYTKCRVRLPVTAMGTDISVTMRSDQKVNLETLVSFDGIALEDYRALGKEVEIPSKGIVLTSMSDNNDEETILIAEIDENGDYQGTTQWPNYLKTESGTGFAQGFIQPNFGIVEFQEIETYTPSSYIDYIQSSNFTSNSIYQILKYTGSIDLPDVEFSLNLKGRIVDRSFASRVASYRLLFLRKSISGGNTEFYPPVNIPRTSVSNTYDFYEFDINVNGDIFINRGDELYAAIFVSYNKTTSGWYELWYEQKRAFVKFYTLSKTEATPCKTFMINEAISRTVEAYSNGDVKILSDFLGRTDSLPYSHEQDGCGSLLTLTNGLFLRRIEDVRPDTPPIFTQSFNDLFDGIKQIYNIGYGFENDPYRPGKRVLRVEPKDYFFQPTVTMRMDGINDVEIEVIPERQYGEINIGYSKWEAEHYNGLDEFLTKRTYRTGLKANNNNFSKLDLLSNLIASGYAIEITRRYGNVDSSDWRYDNDAFVICMKRDDEGNLVVEQGGIASPENIIDPPSILNYRISPFRNLMRFAKDIFSVYKTINIDSKLIFTSGEANFYAKGQYINICALEDTQVAENQNLEVTVYKEADNFLPAVDIETVVFQYPISFGEMKTILDNPYGLVGWSTNGGSGYGWIQQIKRNPVTGLSDVTLLNSRIIPD